MIYKILSDPFDHLIIPNFLSPEETNTVYNKCCKVLNKKTYEDRSMFLLHGEHQTSVGLIGADIPNNITDKIYNNLYDLSVHRYKYNKKDWKWVGGLNVTNPDMCLGVHTDDYEYVRTSNPNAGILKVLIYLGDDSCSYEGWGTRLYNGSDKNENFVSEVEFVPGTALLFKATNKSYHGTEFPFGINSYRFIYGAELTDA
jgi:hypothetical protein